MISDDRLREKATELLETFHERRLSALNTISLAKLLQKNPYLYRSIGISSASDYVKHALDAFISSSDETIFGNVFFEPLAKWAASEAAVGISDVSVQAGGGAGFDIAIESTTEYRAIAVKSGKNIFNAQSGKQQNTEFDHLMARIRKEKKVFHAIIGYGYGRKRQKEKHPKILKLAGQAFWAEVTGDEHFYLRMASLLGQRPAELNIEFLKVYSNRQNVLEKQFHLDYTDAAGNVLWGQIIEFSSALVKPKKRKK